jgi:hypothetical protein
MENTRYLLDMGAALPVYGLKELRVKMHLILSQKHLYETMCARARAAGHPEAALIAAKTLISLLDGEYPDTAPALREMRGGT